MTGTLLTPGWFVALVVWNFMVLAAAQLTIRLIMAFSVRTTLLGTMALTVAAREIGSPIGCAMVIYVAQRVTRSYRKFTHSASRAGFIPASS